MTGRIRTAAAALAILLTPILATAPAQAESIDAKDDGSWAFSLTPYLFLPVSTSGTSAIAGREADLNLNLADIFDLLNLAGAARFEAWRGNFGFIVDGYYVNIGGGGSVEPAGGLVSASVDVKVKQGWVALLGAYRVAHGTLESGGKYAFDVGGGVRYNNLRQTVDAKGSIDIGPGPGRQTKLGGSEVWWEPTLTARGTAQVSDRWTLALRADFGGFGVSGSNLQWMVVAGADYRAWENTSVRLGWQVYGIDFSTNRSDGAFKYDIVQTGPYLGLAFRF